MTAVGFKNQQVQLLRQLLGRRAARQESGLVALEGAKLLSDALGSDAKVETVFLDADAAGESDREVVSSAQRGGAAVVAVQPGVLARACDAVSPQPVAAIVRRPDVTLEALLGGQPSLVLVLVEVQDPGNAGSLIRSVAAAGSGAVILSSGCVDLYNPKTVRASAGSMFSVPVVAGVDPQQAIAELKARAYAIVATAARGGTDYAEVDLSASVALLLGNEAHGLPEEVLRLADSVATIPISEAAESLGVAATGAVLCFEAARRRGTHRVAGAA